MAMKTSWIERPRNSNLLAGHPAEDHARFCFSKLRFYPVGLKDDLRQRGLWDDLAQELYRIALDAWQAGKTPQEMGGMATRELRAFLRAYGYQRRGDSFVQPETVLSGIGEESEADWENILAGAMVLPASYSAPAGLEEAILTILRKHPDGFSQHQVNHRLQQRASGAVVSDCCARLVMRGLVREVPRRRNGNTGGLPGPLLMLSGEPAVV